MVYRIALNIDDIPKLGVVFPSPEDEEHLVTLPLVLPMGWKNSPPAFCAATETVVDLANDAVQSRVLPLPHPLNKYAVAMDEDPLAGPDLVIIDFVYVLCTRGMTSSGRARHRCDRKEDTDINL